MTINTNYLSSSDLDEYFVDKDTGLPLAGGILTFYRDVDRTTLKPIYTVSGNPPDYTFVALPNPLTLDDSGTPVDQFGNRVKIYYFPYTNESASTVDLYYVTVVSSTAVPQFTREAWPPEAVPGSSGGTGGSGNYIINGQFYYNIGASANPIGVLNLEVAPSGTELLTTVKNMQFEKTNTVVTDVITFNQFGVGNTMEGNPLYYCNYTCSAVNGGGETDKNFLWGIKNVNSFQGQQITFSIQARSTLLSTITIDAIQNFGTGGSPSAQLNTLIGSQVLTATFAKYSFTITVPSTSAKTLGTNGNNYFGIELSLPLNAVCSIDFTNVQLEIGSNASAYFFESLDRIAALALKPSTGEVTPSLKTTKFGYLPMNNETIGSPASAATYANNNTYALYSFLWNNISNTYAPVSTGRGVSADADFTANKTLQLLTTTGRLLGCYGFDGTNTYVMGENAGAATVALTSANNGPHTHSFTYGDDAGPSSTEVAGKDSLSAPYTQVTSSSGSGTPFAIIPPSIFMNLFIKL